MVFKEKPLPEDIVKRKVEYVNRIWRDVKLKGSGLKKAMILVTAAEHNIGKPGSARSN